MNKYAGSITIVDDEGNVVFERELAADEMIEEVLQGKEFSVVNITETKEKTDIVATVAPARRDAFIAGIKKGAASVSGGGETSKKKGSTCSKCGQSGHNAKTCGRAQEVADELSADAAAEATKRAKKDREKFLEGFKRMVDAGCGVPELQLAYPKMSIREIEEEVAYVQHNK